MTHLQAAAKFLGPEYGADRQGIWRKTDAPDWASQTLRVSCDELCMALLRRAAEKKRSLSLGWETTVKGSAWACGIGGAFAIRPTPLSAVLAAIAALEGEQQ